MVKSILDALGARVVRKGAVLLVLILMFGLLHVVYRQTGAAKLDLDGELTPAALYSALLLAAAGALVVANAATRRVSAITFGLGALLLLMSVDELVEWHERLEASLGVDWQVLYAPVILAGAAAWLLLLRETEDRPARALLVLGALAWGVSQVLEAVQWQGSVDVKHRYYGVMMPIEEMLEMGGSLLFLLAALVLWQAVPPASRTESLR